MNELPSDRKIISFDLPNLKYSLFIQRLMLFLCLIIMISDSNRLSAEIVSFPGAEPSYQKRFATATWVEADLQVPQGSNGGIPAVIILHGSAGYKKNGRGGFYSDALLKAGIATLEVNMFSQGDRPIRTDDNLSQVFGALYFAAQHPMINHKKIGVMGFSWGGVLSLRLISKKLNELFNQNNKQILFAAHAPFYPACFAHIRYKNKTSYYERVTGKPIMLFYGGKDDYDLASNCPRFKSMLTKTAQKNFNLKFYPQATHGWDNQKRSLPYNYYAQYANDGKGGQVYIVPDRNIALDSRKTVVDFFKQVLK